MDPANIESRMLCSNGDIYRVKDWPFKPESVYFRPIISQGERDGNVLDHKDCTMTYRAAIGDTISGNAYMDIVPANSTSNWTAMRQKATTKDPSRDLSNQ